MMSLKRGYQSLTVIAGTLVGVASFAADEATAGGSAHWFAIGAAICMAVAAAAGTTAQGRAASTALEGIARNPQSRQQVFVPMLLGLALIESLVILSFVISFMLVSK